MSSQSSKISPEKRRAPQRKRVNPQKARNKQINRVIRITGRVAFILQVLLSLFLIIRVASAGMLPWKYIALITIILLVLSAVTYLMNRRRDRVIRCIGIAISVIVMLMILILNSYFGKTLGLLKSGNSTYKTDDMVVAVKADDPAESITVAEE